MADRAGARRSKILIVGNGPTGVEQNGAVHVDRSCGQFLEELANHAEVTFAQPVEPVEASLNYYGHVLDPRRVRPLLLDRGRFGRAIAGLYDILASLNQARLVYLFFPGTLPRMVGRLCRLIRKPYGLFLRGSQFDQARDRDLIARAQFVLCVSEALAAEVRALNPRSAVVRSAQDLRAEDAWRRPEPAPGAPLDLLYVGRIDEEKGVPELIGAARILHQGGAAFRLRLVGFGRLSGEVERMLASEPELPIEFLGAIDDRRALMDLFRASEIFVLPSHHEGFARVLYEAMLQSCAIVSTMVGGIPAVLRDGENCLAIPVGDAEAIAAAVRRLTDDPVLRQRIASNGHAAVLEIIARVPRHASALVGLLAPAPEAEGAHRRHSLQQ